MDTKALYANSFKQLAQDEGVQKTVYYDSLNIPTIGIGFNLREGLSLEEIELIFEHRWNRMLTELITRLPWAGTLDEARLGALLNMAWNLGVPKLVGFTNMLAALQAGDWNAAKNHALNSIWASQVGKRAYRIATQFEKGEWQWQ